MGSSMEEQLKKEARRLEQQLGEIEEEKGRLSETRDLENTPEDDVDETVMGGKLEVLRETLRDRLLRVRIALRKLRDHSYGVCDRCGKKISARRLRAVPEANYCIECAQKLETDDQ